MHALRRSASGSSQTHTASLTCQLRLLLVFALVFPFTQLGFCVKLDGSTDHGSDHPQEHETSHGNTHNSPGDVEMRSGPQTAQNPFADPDTFDFEFDDDLLNSWPDPEPTSGPSGSDIAGHPASGGHGGQGTEGGGRMG